MKTLSLGRVVTVLMVSKPGDSNDETCPLAQLIASNFPSGDGNSQVPRFEWRLQTVLRCHFARVTMISLCWRSVDRQEAVFYPANGPIRRRE